MGNALDGRHALITGGGTGIGAAAAEQLGAEGAKLSLLGRRIEPPLLIRGAVQTDEAIREQGIVAQIGVEFGLPAGIGAQQSAVGLAEVR